MLSSATGEFLGTGQYTAMFTRYGRGGLGEESSASGEGGGSRVLSRL